MLVRCALLALGGAEQWGGCLRRDGHNGSEAIIMVGIHGIDLGYKNGANATDIGLVCRVVRPIMKGLR